MLLEVNFKVMEMGWTSSPLQQKAKMEANLIRWRFLYGNSDHRITELIKFGKTTKI